MAGGAAITAGAGTADARMVDVRMVDALTVGAGITGEGGNMRVKVSETYDLSTKPDKMGLLGIHTPDGQLVHAMWQGLYFNFRKIRYVSCDVTMACASMLPADPLQIGVEAGDIAPQDMFNPILYKACSNDSMSNLLNKIYAGSDYIDNGTWINVNSVSAENAPEFKFDENKEINQFAMYYGLLADTDGWKKAMPQAGLSMRKLVPLTFELVATQGQPDVVGNIGTSTTYFPDDGQSAVNTNVTNIHNATIGRYMRGNTRRMPAFETMVMTGDGKAQNTYGPNVLSVDNSGSYPYIGDVVPELAHPGKTYNSIVCPNLDAPNCFVAAIVLPPAKLNRLYYRLKVTWTVEFSEPRPLTDLTNWYGLARAGAMSYGSDYDDQAALITNGKSENKQSMVDAGDVDITKVMEGTE